MAKDESIQLRKGVIELAILTLLNRRDYYGGEIVSYLSARKGLDSGAGTIYPILTRLAKSGAVKTRWEESPSGPPRKYYALTPAGKKLHGRQLDTWKVIASELSAIVEGDDE